MITKTQAIKKARTYVSMPHRCGEHDYVVYGPWDLSDPDGPTTEYQANSYAKAVAVRTRRTAKVALALMGQLDDDAVYTVDTSPATTVEGIVDECLSTLSKN